MSINLSALMKQRYDTAANWTAQNPTLLAGEIGIESDTKKWKVGTGSTAWTSLAYAIGGTYPIVNADIAAGAAIVDTKLATIATAGKVSNSATTAASANTASAIVARDASGNFTAGTITAALTGAASSNVLKAGDTMTGVLAVTAGTAALPGIAVSGDTNTGIYSPGADQLAIATGGIGRITVDASGNVNIDSNTLYVDAVNNRVGVNTNSAVGSLHSVAAATNAALSLQTPSTGNTRLAHLYGGNSYSYGVVGIVAGNGTDTGDVYGLGSSSNPTGSFSPTLVWTTSAGQNLPGRVGIGTTGPGGTVDIKAAASTAPLIVQGPSTEFARIDISGRLLVGTSSSRSNVYVGATAHEQIVQAVTATNSYANGLAAINYSASAFAPVISLGLSKSNSLGTNTAVASGDQLGIINFVGNDGTNFRSGAYVLAEVDGGVSTGDLPTRLVFSTTADGASSPTDRLRITNNGSFWSTIPGGSTIYPHFAARAWVNFNGTGTVAISGSGNVSSITDNGVGDYTVNFTTALADANYGVSTYAAYSNNSVASTNVRGIGNCIKSTGSIRVQVIYYDRIDGGAAKQDEAEVNVAIFR
jgi:hypothetical protein